ncbi:MAG TPA: protein kinase [Pyrinomonadaceae bacterium]
MKPLAQNTLIQNRYLIVHLIGKGGMGEVYLAVDQRLGSAVALKRTYFAGDEMLGNAFEREARTLARMRHPVLPKVSDHFGENEEQYLVMEHIAGDDLAKRLEGAQKPFPVSWVMFWADQLLDALSYLHSNEPPIIHRDIKPQNLKLTDDNHIILLDFGLSKTTTGQTHISNSGSTGSVVGYTPHYAPMEQIRGIGTNPKSDLYSLSATLYQLMTNVIPADALTRADAMLNGLADPIQPPHELNPEIPESVSEVILKGMEVSQDKRFGTAREMQKALRRAFTRMQEAMAAQTVAFNIGDVPVAEDLMASPVEKTRLMPSEGFSVESSERPAPMDAPDIDLDATLAFDPAENLEQARHAGIRGDIYSPVAEPNGEVAPPISNSSAARDDRDSFVTVVAGSAAPASGEPVVDSTAVVPSSPKRSRKAFAALGGVAALLVLAIGAVGAGWYLYSNYYAGAVAIEPTPSPEASVEALPSVTPPPSTGAVLDPNIAGDSNGIAGGETNVNSNISEPANVTPDVPPSRVDSDGPSRPSQSRPAANRSGSSGNKATPRPKTNPGRTDILQ